MGLWFSQAEFRHALSLAAAALPHLVVITGDLVDRDPEFARLYYEPLRALANVPHGVWGVLGNHDHYTEPKRIAKFLDGHGLTMLVDRRVNLPNLPLTLVGLDDQGHRRSWLNVSRGLAAVGAPFRLWAWPEIDILTLKKV